MKFSLILLFAVLTIVAIILIKSGTEGWYPSGTYVNTPTQQGIYPTSAGLGGWGGNYYQRLAWKPWGFHYGTDYYRRPNLDAVRNPYIYGGRGNTWSPLPQSQSGVSGLTPYATNYLLANSTSPDVFVPRGNPVPLNSIRWNSGLFGPMLTSLKSPKDYLIGQWVKAGIGYTSNKNDFSTVDVYQLNLDPGRDFFSYKIRDRWGMEIPITLRQGQDKLRDGDTFTIPGQEGKGDYTFSEQDKYTYVYT